jgi:hypothetical protein
VVKESVEPLLDDYRPPGIKSLKFSKFSLGNVSPKIEGCPFVCFIHVLLYCSHICSSLAHTFLKLYAETHTRQELVHFRTTVKVNVKFY